MSINVLLLNSDIIEDIVFGPKHLRNGLVDFMLASSPTVRNCCGKDSVIFSVIRVICDQDMLFKQHINQVCKTTFHHFRNISKIRSILSQGDAEKLIHTFVTSRLDSFLSWLWGMTMNYKE